MRLFKDYLTGLSDG